MTLGHGYQLALARTVRQEAGIATIGVGLLWDPQLIERSLAHGEMDLVALARELLDEPNWALHAAHQLGVDRGYRVCPPEFGWWLESAPFASWVCAAERRRCCCGLSSPRGKSDDVVAAASGPAAAPSQAPPATRRVSPRRCSHVQRRRRPRPAPGCR